MDGNPELVENASPELATPSVGIESVVATHLLAERPARAADLRAEDAAMHELMRRMVADPEQVQQALLDCALELCRADTAGISLLETDARSGTEIFRWTALAGLASGYVGGTTPRDWSPCGVTLDRGSAQLFIEPAACFTYFNQVSPPIREGLVVPLRTSTRTLGTLWILAQREGVHFDWEDARIMTSLANFTTAALELSTRAVKLEQALRERDELLTMVSHDLRTPLTAIAGYAQLAERALHEVRTESATSVRTSVEAIQQAAARMSRQIEALVRVGQATATVDVRRESVDLLALLRRLVTEHAANSNGRLIEVETGLAALVAPCDPIQVGRLVDNLLSNALKYGGDKPVTVSVTTEGDWAVLRVIDRGIGIPEADLPHVFDSFYRGTNVSKGTDGSGIGLASVRRIAEAHGGSAAIDSQEGRGTTVTVRLPLASPASR